MLPLWSHIPPLGSVPHPAVEIDHQPRLTIGSKDVPVVEVGC